LVWFVLLQVRDPPPLLLLLLLPVCLSCCVPAACAQLHLIFDGIPCGNPAYLTNLPSLMIIARLQLLSFL
jgi:hypothetical protein